MFFETELQTGPVDNNVITDSRRALVSYLGSGGEDFDAAVVADVGGRVQQLLDVVDHAVQLQLSGHHVLTGPEDKHITV